MNNNYNNGDMRNRTTERVLEASIDKAHTQFRLMNARRDVAISVFGQSRAQELEEAARTLLYEPSQLKTNQNLSMLNAFELALQIEAELRGRFEEVVRRAWLLVDDTEGQVGGLMQALIQVVQTERAKRGDLSGDT